MLSPSPLHFSACNEEGDGECNKSNGDCNEDCGDSGKSDGNSDDCNSDEEGEGKGSKRDGHSDKEGDGEDRRAMVGVARAMATVTVTRVGGD
jgi:hypothetical protein